MTVRRRLAPYLFLAPALVLLGIFVVYPIIAVIGYSFTDFDIVRPPVPVGLANYEKLLNDPTFWLSIQHSFIYLIVTPVLIVLSIGLAIIVNRATRGIHIFRALYFVPAVSGSIAIGLAWTWLFDRNGFINSVLLSWGVIQTPIQWLSNPSMVQPIAMLYFVPGVSGSIAIGLAWTWLFDRNGFINSVLLSWGLIQTPIQWLSNPSMVLPIAMLLTTWAGIGYYSVIFLAGLQNIPEELYDAARIDGCNNFQKHRYVSIPGLRPQITFVAVISSLAALKVFDEIYVLTGRSGGILDSGVTIVFYLWRQAFVLGHAGYASAIAIALLVITLAFSIVNVRFLERGDAEA